MRQLHQQPVAAALINAAAGLQTISSSSKT
jgi:hypothetical protein